MEEQKRLVKLMKFGKKNHMEAFQSGELFMNTLKYFQTLENCEPRGDKDEGLSAMYQVNGATFSRENDDGEYVPIGTLINQMQYRSKDSANINVFCMSAIQVKPKKQEIDKRNLKFGDTFVLLLDPTEFLTRVKGAAEKRGIKVYHNLVEYVEREKYHGPIGPFRKFREFSYQNEFRIIISRKSQESYKFNIGDISNITELGRLSSLLSA